MLVLYASLLWCLQGQCSNGFTVQELHVNAHLCTVFETQKELPREHDSTLHVYRMCARQRV